MLTFLFIFAVIDFDWIVKLRSGELDLSAQLETSTIYYILLVTFVLMLFQNILTIIPIFLIIMLNIMVFGFLIGFLWTWFSSVVAAIITFHLFKFWLPKVLLNKVNQLPIKQKINNRGFFYLFILRLMPFMPTSIINLAASISTVKLSHFLGSTILGNLIFQFLLSSISIGLLTEGISNYILLTLVAVVIIVYVWYLKINKNKRQNLVVKIGAQHIKG